MWVQCDDIHFVPPHTDSSSMMAPTDLLLEGLRASRRSLLSVTRQRTCAVGRNAISHQPAERERYCSEWLVVCHLGRWLLVAIVSLILVCYTTKQQQNIYDDGCSDAISVAVV
jgi:hypothetical protein